MPNTSTINPCFLLVEGSRSDRLETKSEQLWTTSPCLKLDLKDSGMPFVYILRCSDDSYYVGSTRNIETRVDQHNSGRGAVYTSTRTPVELVFSEEFDDVGESYAMEKRIQGWSRKKREALIRGDFDELRSASRRSSTYQAQEV